MNKASMPIPTPSAIELSVNIKVIAQTKYFRVPGRGYKELTKPLGGWQPGTSRFVRYPHRGSLDGENPVGVTQSTDLSKSLKTRFALSYSITSYDRQQTPWLKTCTIQFQKILVYTMKFYLKKSCLTVEVADAETVSPLPEIVNVDSAETKKKCTVHHPFDDGSTIDRVSSLRKCLVHNLNFTDIITSSLSKVLLRVIYYLAQTSLLI